MRAFAKGLGVTLSGVIPSRSERERERERDKGDGGGGKCCTFEAYTYTCIWAIPQ